MDRRYLHGRNGVWYTFFMDDQSQAQGQAAPFAADYQRFGKRTFVLMISTQMVPSVILFFAAIFFSVAQLNGIFNKTPFAPWGMDVTLIIWAIFVLTFFITYFVTYLVYDNYLFMLGDEALRIKRGILAKEEIAIPYRQIQDVDVEQSITDRMWGVARVAILTAGREEGKGEDGSDDESEGVFPALEKGLADRLQSELLRRTDIQKVVQTQ